MWKATQELYHHGVKGMKWGIRNEDEENKYLREKTNQIAKAEIAKDYVDLYRSSPNSKVLLPSDEHKQISNYLHNGKKAVDELVEVYGDITIDRLSMDDGYDYIRTLAKSKFSNKVIQTMDIIGTTQNKKATIYTQDKNGNIVKAK